jgi:hypothetical protein
MIYYSKSTKGFYTTEIHGTNTPSDCVQITKELHADLLNDQSQGKQIVPDKNGYPITIVPPVVSPTWDQIRSKRDALLKDSDWSVASDATPKPSKEAWVIYRQALRDIPQTCSEVITIIWPVAP